MRAQRKTAMLTDSKGHADEASNTTEDSMGNWTKSKEPGSIVPMS